MPLPRHATGRLVVALLLALATVLPAGGEEWVWDLPAWRQPPPVPADNPMTVEKVELGRRLFYELNLSGPG